ncbi:hypothetical protein [Breznakiella homolactica]|nr:hypothetical protein [Breznakiella homolactica]
MNGLDAMLILLGGVVGIFLLSRVIKRFFYRDDFGYPELRKRNKN